MKRLYGPWHIRHFCHVCDVEISEELYRLIRLRRSVCPLCGTAHIHKKTVRRVFALVKWLGIFPLELFVAFQEHKQLRHERRKRENV